MAENDDYLKLLLDALKARADWLERSELPKLKEELRSYHTGFASLYNIYLKKGLINMDPYKGEAKIGELEVPSSTPFSDMERLDQLTRRLANYDNQLDFLVNFYQFSAEFLNLDRIKRIVGLVKYIDWVHLIPDSQNPMTRVVAEMTNQIKVGSDAVTMSVITEALTHLNRSFNPIMAYLKILSEYQREAYKLDFRDITKGMSQSDAANMQTLRKKFASVKSGTPFYPDLVEEIIKEDFSKEGPELRAAVLKKLQVAEDKPKVTKVQVSFKNILIDGIVGLGGTTQALTDILTKLDENVVILENVNKGFMHSLKKMIQQMLNKEPEPIVYELDYMDPVKAIPVREKINFNSFRNDLERKIRSLSPMTSRSAVGGKLEAMQEEQLIGFLERNLRDIQALHKTLNALDDFFKTEAARDIRDKIKGIKPELGTIKNAIVRANSRRHEYSAQKEEEEQLKRLGVRPES
jgi:hypothetical protein